MFFFFLKQKTAYEMRISDWSSDVCSSDLSKGDTLDALPGIVGQRCLRCRLQPARPAEPRLESDVDWQIQLFRDKIGSGLALVVIGEIGRASCTERVCQYV